jgi:hypothetical protein
VGGILGVKNINVEKQNKMVDFWVNYSVWGVLVENNNNKKHNP